MTARFDARLVLEDGTIFSGRAFGARGEASGEIVFNTSLTGYQEVLTDPSYRGQIVVMTYPLIGNTGINLEDDESERPWLSGFVVRELSAIASNYRSGNRFRTGSLATASWASKASTRRLTRKIRDQGAMTALITTEVTDPNELIRRVKKAPPLVGRDLVKEVTRGKRFTWTEGYDREMQPALAPAGSTGRRPKVVAIDYGAKENIFRSLVDVGFDVVVLPSTATCKDILAEKPDGVFLSNGPGDPSVLNDEVQTIRDLLGKKPIFGICLGHQLLGQAIGAKTFKLKFGHHGSNQPVKNLKTGQVEITAQNHGFAVDPASIPQPRAKVTFINLNDGTCEGLELPGESAFSVQYHPEAAPGPHDSLYLFQQFKALVDASQGAA